MWSGTGGVGCGSALLVRLDELDEDPAIVRQERSVIPYPVYVADPKDDNRILGDAERPVGHGRDPRAFRGGQLLVHSYADRS